MLKGHLKNAVVVELLSAFDGASNKIDANGVHRIKPRHRVSDVAEKSFAEYLDSPVITSKSSIDSEYMGPVIADGEDGSIRFADASIHLGGISDAATSHIKVSISMY
jgi:vacuolar-type H+-ATPase subunit E/Vma4